MHKLLTTTLITTSLLIANIACANTVSTGRISQFSNDKVNVWKTTIYPNTKQILSSHRHEHDRVVVALDSGTLKVTNNKGKTHYLKFVKNTAYYLSKDTPGETHTDENVSHHPISVMVIELQS